MKIPSICHTLAILDTSQNRLADACRAVFVWTCTDLDTSLDKFSGLFANFFHKIMQKNLENSNKNATFVELKVL